MVWTNTGKQEMFETWFEGSSAPASFYLQLTASDAGTSALFNADLSSTQQISAVLVGTGTGYDSSGKLVNRDGVDLSVSVSVSSDYAQANLRTGYSWSATGGSISNISFVLLTGPGTYNQRKIYNYWTVAGGPITVAEGNTFSITAAGLRGT